MKKIFLLFLLLTFIGGAMSQNKTRISSIRINQDNPENANIILCLKEIASKELRNRNIELERYVIIGIYKISYADETMEYSMGYMDVDSALNFNPMIKGNPSKEYPSFEIIIDKERKKVTRFAYSK